MLRLIEDVSGEDDAKLQSSFKAQDSCGGKRIIFIIKYNFRHICVLFL